ncbi:hypothetical protein N8600_06325 [Gammaproteobacteria bacterium]|nr:hypothetical protein [Gammaproteobacteria bacterium]
MNKSVSTIKGMQRESAMAYIAEILSDDVIWLINENRRLISIHQAMDEAIYYCQKHFQATPVIIDRRASSAIPPLLQSNLQAMQHLSVP